MKIFGIIGWLGFMLFVASYFLLSIGKLRSDRVPYQLLNVVGGLCLVISAYDTKAWPNLYTNLIWTFIGLYALVLIRKKRKKRKDQ